MTLQSSHRINHLGEQLVLLHQHPIVHLLAISLMARLVLLWSTLESRVAFNYSEIHHCNVQSALQQINDGSSSIVS